MAADDAVSDNTTGQKDDVTAAAAAAAAGGVSEYDLSFYVIFYKFTVPLLFGVVALLGMTGNLLVIYVVLSRSDMRRNTVNMLLLNLAISDLTFSGVCVPSIAYHYAADNWTLGAITCRLSQYLVYVTTYVTAYTLVAVAIVRVCKVTLSTARSRDDRNVSISSVGGRCSGADLHVVLVVTALWVVTLLANVPVYFSYRIKTYVTLENATDVEPYIYCGIEDETRGWRINITFFVLAYLAPLTVIASMYFTLLHHLHRQARHSSISIGDSRVAAAALRANLTANASSSAAGTTPRTSTIVSRRASHVTRVLVVVVAVFAACWLPLHIHLLVAYCGAQPAHRWYEIYRVLAHCLAYANSCMNPVIYSYVSSDFRRRFSDVMLLSGAGQPCHRRSSHQYTADGQPQVRMVHMRNPDSAAEMSDQRGNICGIVEL